MHTHMCAWRCGHRPAERTLGGGDPPAGKHGGGRDESCHHARALAMCPAWRVRWLTVQRWLRVHMAQGMPVSAEAVTVRRRAATAGACNKSRIDQSPTSAVSIRWRNGVCTEGSCWGSASYALAFCAHFASAAGGP